ncbi:CD1375 family protein [Clostridiaceae bacterium M8S5]|nr:CD1375 family protein [Clostridiaceae bacterium M8S5]
MISIYARLIDLGLKTIEQVPEIIREEVRAIL